MPRAAAATVAAVRARVAAALGAAGLPDGATVAVACSGGPDSMALADATLAALGPARVVFLHVDHRLRAGSAADAGMVAGFAAARGATCWIAGVDVDPAPAGGSLEAAARRARYAALAELADDAGAALVLTAHTARDQAETVLMRIVRGTGPAGLAGIPPRRGRYLRPLLATTRAEIDAYVAACDLPVARDPTNDDPRFFRNRVRADLMPRLVDENPRIEAALCRLAAAAREDRAAIAAAARALAAAARVPAGGAPPDPTRVAFAAPALAAAPAAVAKRVIARAAAPLGLAPEAGHLDRILRLCRGPAAGSRAVDVPGGRAVREYDVLVLAPATGASAPPPDAGAALEVDGPAGPAGYQVRAWRPGDRMRPARLRGRSRKLSDLYADARVPRAARATARVVVRAADRTIVWAEHIGIAFEVEVRVTPAHSGGRRGPSQG